MVWSMRGSDQSICMKSPCRKCYMTWQLPRKDAGGLRILPPYPQRVVKGDWMGGFSKSPYKHSGSIPRNACVTCERKLCVTTGQTDGQTPDKVIPMCRFASQATRKGWPRVGAWTVALKNPTKCLWRWEPDRRYNFFSPPAHLCRHIHEWNIVACDVKLQYTHSLTRHDNW